ncbi:MAG: choice-of-anchor V domain-containing protein [candidate division WOR-3 bacterium]
MRKLTSVMLATSALLLAYTRTPPNANTGRPGEVTCANCHEGAVGSADSTQLTGLPAMGYLPDSTFRLTLSVRYRGMRAWGFEITCADSANRPAGTFKIIDSIHTQLGTSRGFSYVKQTGPGAYKGKPGSCAWTFAWRAPAAGTGPVTFYWDVLPCNNDGGVYGDVDIPGSLTVPEWSPPVKTPRRYMWHYPAPESASVLLSFSGRTDLPLRVYSADGKLAGLLSATRTDVGELAPWSGLDSTGRPVPAGDYFFELGGTVDTIYEVIFVPRQHQ